jgi:hypothetical protein
MEIHGIGNVRKVEINIKPKLVTHKRRLEDNRRMKRRINLQYV